MESSTIPRRLGRLAFLFAVTALGACSDDDEKRGGGQTEDQRSEPDPADIALPEGYRIEAVTAGLNFPTGVAMDDEGRPHVVEAGYSYGEVFTEPRLLRIEDDGSTTEIATGEHPPWNGVDFRDGAFYVAEGGELGGGRIVRIVPGEEPVPIVTDLPSLGDHHTNGPAIDDQGALYFAVGTATNSGVVGEDNFDFGWLERHPEFHDIPCEDVMLAGENYESSNPLTDDPDDRVTTGAYLPFGTPGREGQVVAGQVPCSGAIFRVAPEELTRAAGSGAANATFELVAWGFRNPYGLAFRGAELFATENGYDERGSRPVFGTGDVLWSVESGNWYGWPDHSAGRPLADERFEGSSPPPDPLLLERPSPPEPAALLAVHSASNGLDFSRNEGFGHVGEAFIAQLGDMAPNVGAARDPVGFKVVRVDTQTGVVHDFATNKGEVNGPGTYLESGGLERPIAVRFDAEGAALYVLDFGVIRVSERGAMPEQESGILWKISRGER